MKSIFSFLLLICCVSAAGCATVAPYQREHLAKPSMDDSSDGTAPTFRSHVHDAREGATGGHGSTGGGCGCN